MLHSTSVRLSIFFVGKYSEIFTCAERVLCSGRHQAAVCELDGFVYVIGGAESWNCLNSVERYNPNNNTWTLVASMNVARRGAGVVVHEGKKISGGL